MSKSFPVRTCTVIKLGCQLVTLAIASMNANAAEGIRPTIACTDMAGLKIPANAIGLRTGGAVISSAALDTGIGTQTGLPAADLLPEHCRIDGAISPVDPNAPAIHFRITIPTVWNQKSWHIGGNGMNGFIPNLARIARDRPGSPLGPAYPPNAPFPIAQGYATYGSDSGHGGPDEPTPDQIVRAQVAREGGPPVRRAMDLSWMSNSEALRNFAHEQLKKTHDTAMYIIKQMYGVEPKTKYFGGESQGGRDALGAIAQYGEDYDGVLVSVPLAYFSGILVSTAYRVRLQTAPGAWVPPSKAAAIESETLRQCDALDGLEDGVIHNYAGCNRRMDPSITPNPLAAIRCEGGSDTGDHCLSDAQIATVNALRAPMQWGFPMANGETDWPGVPAGMETAGWVLMPAAPDPAKPASGPINPTTILGLIEGAPNKYDLFKQGFRELEQPLKNLSALLDARTDWSKLFKHGGKVLYHSAANDYLTNSRAHMRLYEAVVKRHGQEQVDQYARFYVTPQANHGSVGFSSTTKAPLPRYMDLLSALQDWVEKDVTPPDAIAQTLMDSEPPYTVRRSRPLCRYPSYPHYDGRGDPTRMQSYACTKP